MSFPWKYRSVSAGFNIDGCDTRIVPPGEEGCGEVLYDIDQFNYC